MLRGLRQFTGVPIVTIVGSEDVLPLLKWMAIETSHLVESLDY